VQSLSEIRALLASRGLAPRHALGQNFLIDHNLLRKLVEASGAGPGDLVLEVGPGTGTLTEALLEAGATVIACELDRGLAQLLRETLLPKWNDATSREHDGPISLIGPIGPIGPIHPPHRLALIEGDCLASKRQLAPAITEALAGSPGGFRLVSNLPYSAATPLLLTLLIDHPECHTMAITIQREVADRITAAPGSRAYGALSVIAQRLCDIDRIATLPPHCFWPRPKVDSAMIRLTRRTPPPPEPPALLADTCNRLFANRRKQLRATLAELVGSEAGRGDGGDAGEGPQGGGNLEDLSDIDPASRPEALTPAQIARIALMRRSS
jgi:16S rRNA (adenine1518-N6/adenine1519-N6)-dimethyltransferase